MTQTDPRDLFISANPTGLSEGELEKGPVNGFVDDRAHADYLVFKAGLDAAQAAEQHRGEPVAWSPVKPVAPGAYWIRGNGLDQEALIQVIDEDGELRCNLHQRTTETDFGYGYAIADLSHDFEWLGPLLPADPGEVERVENERAEQWRLRRDAEADRDTKAAVVAELRAQLAEAHALLRGLDDAWNRHDGRERFGKLMAEIEAVVSASAEPSSDLCKDGAHEFVMFRSECVKCGEPYSPEPSTPVERDERADYREFRDALHSQKIFKLDVRTILAAEWGFQARAALEPKP